MSAIRAVDLQRRPLETGAERAVREILDELSGGRRGPVLQEPVRLVPGEGSRLAAELERIRSKRRVAS